MDITVSEDIDSEFLEVVRDILEDREFKKLNCFRQHLKTTRFMHSLNVSYISWCLARRFRCDARAAARAGPVSYTHLDVYKRQLWKKAPSQVTSSVSFSSRVPAAIRAPLTASTTFVCMDSRRHRNLSFSSSRMTRNPMPPVIISPQVTRLSITLL